MKTKFLVYPALTIALGFMAAACSSDSDNDNDEPEIGTPVDMPIPSSIVDGVRVADAGNVKISYNTDGSIKDAELDGTVYEFEYEGSRASMTGRKLARIVTKYSDYNSSDSWQATNFQFNTDGFIVSYLEINKTTDEDFWEKTTLHVTVDYNAHGRISSMNVHGDYEGVDEDGHYKDRASGSVKYTYTGGSLESSVISDSESTSRYTYEYNLAHSNTYNVVTPQLAMGMAHYSPIAYVFAAAGYLGNASSQLPTKLTYSYIDHEEPEYSSSDNYNISYRFNDHNRITAITSEANGIPHSISMTYIEQK